MAFKTKLDTRNAQGFKFEKIGQKLQGYYIGTFEEVINGKPVNKHLFKTSKGTESVLGQTHLTQLLQGVELGTMIIATFVGTKKTKQPQPMKLFELEFDDADMIDPTGAITAASQDADADAEEPEYSDPDAAEETQEEEAAEEEVAQEPVRQAARPAQRAAAPATKASATRPGATTLTPEQRARASKLLGTAKA